MTRDIPPYPCEYAMVVHTLGTTTLKVQNGYSSWSLKGLSRDSKAGSLFTEKLSRKSVLVGHKAGLDGSPQHNG